MATTSTEQPAASIRTKRGGKPLTLWPTENGMSLEAAMTLSLGVLRQIGGRYKTWVVPFSGGKDSSALATFVAWAIKTGAVPAPDRLLVLRSDTGQELPELSYNAEALMAHLRVDGFDARLVSPTTRNRWYVQILGKGLLPAHPGMGGRWCTRALKVDPMKAVIDALAAETGERFLLMSGVRMGESASRNLKLEKSLSASDEVHYPSCSAESGECGSGGVWMDKRLSKHYDAVPLVVHWRTCSVFDWLMGWYVWNDEVSTHDYVEVTRPVAVMYGLGEDGTLEEEGVRYGCLGCSVVKKDRMLIKTLKKAPILTPLQELNGVWSDMRERRYRLWKSMPGLRTGGVYGPLAIEYREYFLARLLDIHARAGVTLITEEDRAEIACMIAAETYPRGWTGREWYYPRHVHTPRRWGQKHCSRPCQFHRHAAKRAQREAA